MKERSSLLKCRVMMLFKLVFRPGQVATLNPFKPEWVTKDDMSLFKQIHSFREATKSSPSRQELVEICGVDSFQEALRKLKRLQRAGLVAIMKDAPYPLCIIRDV